MIYIPLSWGAEHFSSGAKNRSLYNVAVTITLYFSQKNGVNDMQNTLSVHKKLPLALFALSLLALSLWAPACGVTPPTVTDPFPSVVYS